MEFKVQSSKFKVVRSSFRLTYLLLAAHCLLLAVSAQTNELNKIADGGFVEKWLVSNQFPAEIDAGAWENFNRFNIENLPQKDWLAPFGGVKNIKPQIGAFKATARATAQETPKSESGNSKSGEPLPEVGAQSNAKTFADATEISWREVRLTDARFDFFNLYGGKTVGTAYAASRIDTAGDETRFVETDGFLGAIWLNGEKIYDGFSLDVKKVNPARFKKGANLLLVRASGVANDYWRKDGGWSGSIRIWKSERAAENAAEFKPSGAPGTIFYLEGFHVDPVYLHDQRGYARITLSNTAQYLRNLRSDARYGVYLSEIDYLKPYLDTHPEDREFLRAAVAQGRVGTGGAYNQFNENTIGGEAIVRNILYGQLMHGAMLGRKAESLALWDVFGHAPQISQIAAKAGFTGLVWSKKIIGFEPFFYDYALDGSRLLHRRVDYAYSFSGFGSGKNYSFDNFRRTTERKFAEAQSFNSAIDLRINAADFTPPWTNLTGNVEKLEAQKPQIRVSGQAQDLYFRELNREIAAGKTKPPISSRDKLFFHVGVNMARSDLKIGQRVSENMTLTAEKFGSVAYLLGAKYPDLALDKAWRQIFFGSHHDAITGTPSDNALLDLVHGYREAYELSENALADSLQFIAKQIDTKPALGARRSKAQPIVVFNPLNWTRNDVVKAKVKFDAPPANFRIRDEKGALSEPRILNRHENEIEFEFVAGGVPSIGYKTFYAEPIENRRIAVDRNYPKFLENEFYRIEIDANRGGAITSIFDKQAKKEVIDISNNHFGNEIAVLQEELTKKNVIYPAWELWTTGKKSFSSETKATFSFERSGAARVLKISGVLPNQTKYVQTISLHDRVKRIDFVTELVDYKGRDELFVVNFPLNLSGGALVTEDRFGTVVRNNSKGFLDFRTNTDRLVSGAPVYAANNWAEYGSALDLNFVDGASETVASVPFKPTALVRPRGESYEAATAAVVANLIKRGVSVTPFYDDNDAARRAKLPIEDSTMPKKLNDDIAYHGFRIALGSEKENLYSAELLKLVSAETRRKFDARRQKDGFAFLFLYDKNVPEGFAPMPVLIVAGTVEKAIENLLAPVAKNEFAVRVAAESFAAETNPRVDLPRVPGYGVALINNGTAGVSLENPNTLTLFLTHTAVFPGVNLPFDFVPEHKTHVFKYSLYPHEKDWREADVVRVGENFNNPLIAVQTDAHDGNLPNEKSFVELQSDNVVISSLKVGGDPQANFRSIYRETERPLSLRFYETEGRKTSPIFKLGRNGWQVGETSLLENEPAESLTTDGDSFGTELSGFAIKTFNLKPKKPVPAATRDAGASVAAETVQPVFSRYWLHNSGAAPIGNDAVKISLRPLEQSGELSTFAYDDKYNQGGTTTVAARVQIVNNYHDRRISGEAVLEVPENWRVVPERIAYDVEPNGSFVKDIAVIAFPVKKNLAFERASGLIKARTAHDGQIFEDVLNLGKTFALEWTTAQTENETVVVIKNPHRQTIQGAVALIAPPEAWFFRSPTFPREQGFTVAPDSEIELRFATGGLPAGTWKIARIAYNGNVDYKRADGL